MMKTATILLSLCLAASAQQTYQLVWSDEFNGNSLDLSKWQYEVNCDGGGNNELQCYTNSANNLKVANGALQITARPENINGKQYSSARINTKASAAWRYGRIDFSAQLPNGIYTWPALWMMPRDGVYGGGWWAASGEIDIMENRGNTNQVESTLHYGGGWPNNIYSGSGPVTQPFDLTAGYHLYSAIWTPDSIQFLVDNNVYHTETLQRNFWSGLGSNPYTANGQPFDQYFFIIINLAIGGNFFGGNANALTVQQAQAWANPTLSVDYVRVYQLQNGAVNNNPAPVAAPTSVATPAPTPVATGSATSGCQQVSYCPSTLCGCSGACYNPAVYHCANGGLQQGAEPANAQTPVAQQAPSSSSTSSTTSSTVAAAVATSAAAAAPANNNRVCSRAGYCSPTACACNGACYSASQYCCINNQLTQIAFC